MIATYCYDITSMCEGHINAVDIQFMLYIMQSTLLCFYADTYFYILSIYIYQQDAPPSKYSFQLF